MKIKFSRAIYAIVYDFKNKKTRKVGSQKKTLFIFVIQLSKQPSPSYQ